MMTKAILVLSGSLQLAILVKASVLLALGLAAARVAARASASVRHLVLAATFAALVTLPFVIATAPQVGVYVPIVSASPAQELAPAPERAGGTASIAAPAATRGWEMPSWTAIVRAVWIGGAIIQLLFLCSHLLRLRRLRRTAIPWLERRKLVESLAADCGVRRRVDVLLHENVAAPITCGFRRPAILLPFEARAWSESDLRRAAVHELEHVRRCDWATQLAARTTAAFYWFHPLVWAAWRRLCLEAERAADDAVLRHAESTDYAGQLVGLARRMSNAHAQPALGMANRSDLSARVTALLDGTQRRGRAGFLAAAGAAVVAGLVLAAIGPLTAVAQSSESRNARTGSRRVSALDRALYEAAEAGDLQDIDSLLNAGANVNAAIRGDGSPLIGAARKGQLAAIARLLDRDADPNMPVSGDGNPLIMAAAEGHADVVSLLLDRGARIDEVVPGDENALIQASGEGRLNVVKLLVSRGANVNLRLWVETGGAQPRGEWRSPLIMARKNGHRAVADFLIASGARE